MTNSTYRNIILLALCVTAGIVDVIGYLSLGHIFTANMTGNIVLLGLAIGNSLETTVFHSLTALGGFSIGVIGAAIIVGNKEKTFWPKAVTIALGLEGLLLLVFALLSSFSPSLHLTYLFIFLLSSAMGLQTTAARKLGVAGISTTVLTGTLANFFEDVTARLRSPRYRKTFTTDAILRALSLVFYCFGAAIAALAEPAYKFEIIWLPIVILLAIIIFVSTKFRSHSEKK
ncbi:YoaK family protein [Priestia aryabhattai]|uniref:YoaK family protein n=1 Tax=Priestia aryabhattai TaxID=412384 RepID=UPI0015F609D8|nr:YoaK family protein [Priestia aryabhattai]